MKEKILIIDDDVDLCRLLKNNLGIEGYDVNTSHDGEAGLMEFRRNQYQLVVLDILLPLKNGYDGLSFYYYLYYL